MDNVLHVAHLNLGNGSKVVLTITQSGCSKRTVYTVKVKVGQMVTPLFDSPDRDLVDSVFHAVEAAYNTMAAA